MRGPLLLPSTCLLIYRAWPSSSGSHGVQGTEVGVLSYRNIWTPRLARRCRIPSGPRFQLRPKDSKAAFIRRAGGKSNQPYCSGRFLDLKTPAWALRNKSLSLEGACREFKVPGKLIVLPAEG
jgi:hypothetical protein